MTPKKFKHLMYERPVKTVVVNNQPYVVHPLTTKEFESVVHNSLFSTRHIGLSVAENYSVYYVDCQQGSSYFIYQTTLCKTKSYKVTEETLTSFMQQSKLIDVEIEYENSDVAIIYSCFDIPLNVFPHMVKFLNATYFADSKDGKYQVYDIRRLSIDVLCYICVEVDNTIDLIERES